MNQDAVKELLLDIESSSLDFSVTFTGKESKRVNGLYKPDTYEILLHNKNFKTDNQLVYTAIHEYAHHLINEAKGGIKYSPRSHTAEFWARFHGLLEVAEQKGVYKLELTDSPELEELTKEIQENYLTRNGQLMIEFGKLLGKAHVLCQAANIRYEDYVDRVLRLPRSAARAITQVSAMDANPEMGFETMKALATIPKGEKRELAKEQLMQGKTLDMVRTMMKKPAETDQKVVLQQEKQRIEKTIDRLQSRLEELEENLASL